jgi:hypothetical protein
MFSRTELQIANCKLQNENCRTEEDRKFAICNLHFSFCNRRGRRGISLTEVLIAMGIMTVGLLGVASVFPVGSWYAHKATVADQGSAIAQSVMNDLVTRGMLNPDAWRLMTPVPVNATPTSPNFLFAAIDGKYCPAKTPVSSTFTRPYAEALAEGLRQNPPDKSPLNKVVLARQFGHAIVIDPMFISSATRNVNTSANIAAYGFPAASCMSFPWTNPTYYKAAGWDPWRAAGNKTQALNGEKTWPIRRASFQMSNGWPLDKSAADSICRGTDDLAYEFPDRDDRPSQQNWDTVADVNGNQMPMARKWTGDYSWIASIVPTTNAARDGMARNPEGFAYEVSVVVFHKRPLPAGPPATGSPADLPTATINERSVSAAILSTGLNGGELLLTDQGDISNQSPFNNLKSGQWIMLCGPHPNSSMIEPRFVLNWYQVKAIDKAGTGIQSFNPNTQRVVTVRGPQWPWKPSSNLSYNDLSNDLCVGICRGAVAVHTKSIRLESSLGGSYGTGMSIITPAGVPPDFSQK